MLDHRPDSPIPPRTTPIAGKMLGNGGQRVQPGTRGSTGAFTGRVIDDARPGSIQNGFLQLRTGFAMTGRRVTRHEPGTAECPACGRRVRFSFGTTCVEPHFIEYTRLECSGSGRQVPVAEPKNPTGVCPDCERRVRLTAGKRISAHTDRAKRPCTGGGKAPMARPPGAPPTPRGHPGSGRR